MRSREGTAPARHPAIAMAFLAGAIVLGGGGSPNPGTEVLLQLLFVAAALAWLWLPSREGGTPAPQSRTFWLVAALALVLPVVQLLPLPPSVWTGLPGQQDRAAALALVGRDQSWQPLTHSPPRTLAALLAIFPALFAFFAAASLDARNRHWLVAVIAAMAVVSALLGALQLSLGASAPHIYPEHHLNVVTGFQANRNATVDVMLIGMAAVAVLLAPSLAANPADGRFSRSPLIMRGRRGAGLLLVGLLTVLFFAAVFTASRTGIVLLPLVLLAIWALVQRPLADLGRIRFVPVVVILVAMALLAAWALRDGNLALAGVADRFVFDEEYRGEMWRDAWFMAERAWPAGIGLGGAQSALIAAERLEVLDPLLPNRVHNDYLELLLEGGLLGVVLLGTIVLALAWRGWRTWRDRPQERHLTALGLIILFVAAAHSFVDYPLRSMALACLIGTGAGLLLPSRRGSGMAAAAEGSRAEIGGLV